MKATLCFTLLLVSLLSGCAATARLYPVSVAGAAPGPPEVIVGRITGKISTGTLTFKLSDGEVCKGDWAMVKSAQATGATAPDEMAPVWDAVYGQGFYTAHVLGARMYARGQAKGDRGTVLDVELYRPTDVPNDAGAAGTKGVAKDGNGNIYKLTLG